MNKHCNIDPRNLAACTGVDCKKKYSCQRFKNAKEFKQLIHGDYELMVPFIDAPIIPFGDCPHFFPTESCENIKQPIQAGCVNTRPFGWFEAKVKATGEIIIVRKTNPSHIEEFPTYEKIGDDGGAVKEYKFFELEFLA